MGAAGALGGVAGLMGDGAETGCPLFVRMVHGGVVRQGPGRSACGVVREAVRRCDAVSGRNPSRVGMVAVTAVVMVVGGGGVMEARGPRRRGHRQFRMGRSRRIEGFRSYHIFECVVAGAIPRARNPW